eukprot:g3162.t1
MIAVSRRSYGILYATTRSHFGRVVYTDTEPLQSAMDARIKGQSRSQSWPIARNSKSHSTPRKISVFGLLS